MCLTCMQSAHLSTSRKNPRFAAHTLPCTAFGPTMRRVTVLARRVLGHRTAMTHRLTFPQNVTARLMQASYPISAVKCLKIGPAMDKLTLTSGNMNGTNMVSTSSYFIQNVANARQLTMLVLSSKMTRELQCHLSSTCITRAVLNCLPVYNQSYALPLHGFHQAGQQTMSRLAERESAPTGSHTTCTDGRCQVIC